jgi:hypothetical protein
LKPGGYLAVRLSPLLICALAVRRVIKDGRRERRRTGVERLAPSQHWHEPINGARPRLQRNVQNAAAPSATRITKYIVEARILVAGVLEGGEHRAILIVAGMFGRAY